MMEKLPSSYVPEMCSLKWKRLRKKICKHIKNTSTFCYRPWDSRLTKLRVLVTLFNQISFIDLPPSCCAPGINSRLSGSCSSVVFPVTMHSMSSSDAGKFSPFRIRWMVLLASQLEAFPAGPGGWCAAIIEVWESLSSLGSSPGLASVLRSSLTSTPFLPHTAAAVFQAPIIDKTVFSPLYILASFVTD